MGGMYDEEERINYESERGDHKRKCAQTIIEYWKGNKIVRIGMSRMERATGSGDLIIKTDMGITRILPEDLIMIEVVE